MHDEIQTREED